MGTVTGLPAHYWLRVEIVGDGCWLWTTPHPDGYGRFAHKGKRTTSHRWSYEAFNGPIQPGLVIDHLCRNRGCVRPSHLRAVTPLENMMAEGSLSLGHIHAMSTHCPRGHVYDIAENGHRGCSICLREYKRSYRRLKNRRQDGETWNADVDNDMRLQ